MCVCVCVCVVLSAATLMTLIRYVGGLSPTLSEREVVELMSSVGRVLASRVRQPQPRYPNAAQPAQMAFFECVSVVDLSTKTQHNYTRATKYIDLHPQTDAGQLSLVRITDTSSWLWSSRGTCFVVVGLQPHVVCSLLVVVGCWLLLAVGCWLLVVGCCAASVRAGMTPRQTPKMPFS